jgi:hypothetical protein
MYLKKNLSGLPNFFYGSLLTVMPVRNAKMNEHAGSQFSWQIPYSLFLVGGLILISFILTGSANTGAVPVPH